MGRNLKIASTENSRTLFPNFCASADLINSKTPTALSAKIREWPAVCSSRNRDESSTVKTDPLSSLNDSLLAGHRPSHERTADQEADY